MGVISRIATNIRDVRAFGPLVLARHFGRLRRDRMARIRVGRHSLHLRAGESDIAAVRQIFVDQEYDFSGFADAHRRVVERYEQILANGKIPVIVDAGANIGAAAIWFADTYPDATVVAIEPDPGNVEVLRRNVAHLPNVRVLDAAIGSQPGHVSIVSSGLGWATQTERAAQGIRVITMDEATAAVPNGVPFIAKVDIEGFERDLFANNLDWIDRMAEVLIEPHDWMLPGEYSSASFQKAFGDRGFEMFFRGENLCYVR